jgi:DNA gyrase subunit B
MVDQEPSEPVSLDHVKIDPQMKDEGKGGYTPDTIKALEGMEAVRLRPGMYIGSTDQNGLHHLVYEVVDNAIDEAMAGYCDKIFVLFLADGSVEVTDDGRGIPIGIHPTTGRSTLELIMTTLHAGGKFGGGAYKVSGGLHGVGSSVVNALSDFMRVEVRRNGHLYYQEYRKGDPIADVADAGPLPDEQKEMTGTKVRFLADPDIFTVTAYDRDVILQRFREMAYLNRGVSITLNSETHPDEDKTFFFQGGISSFVRHLNRSREVLHDEPFYVQQVVESTTVEVALQYNGSFHHNTYSFANCINTSDGGKHLEGFYSALTRAINSYARKQKLLRDDQSNLAGEDVREGLTAVVSVKLTDPQFQGQTKGRLGNAEVKGIVETIVVKSLEFYLEEHPNEARRIIDKCFTSQRAREAARKARDLVIRKNAMDGGSLPGKLADCSERNPELCELYVVEGESAGGSAKMGRDRRTQAILPLKGKILNVEKARPEQMLGHEEIRALITAIGAGLGEEFNVPKLRYHRVIIMTDADVDGAHIRTLLLTFFYRHMWPLIENGYLYIAQPPLYRVSRGRSVGYKYSEADKDAWVASQMYGRISLASNDKKVKLQGPEIHDLILRLKEFQLWSSDFASIGLLPELVGIFFKGLKSKFPMAFEGKITVEALQAWFAENDYTSTPKVNQKEQRFNLVVDGVGTLDVRRLFESPALNRCLQLFGPLSKYLSGRTYTLIRRDNEVAQDVPWFELAETLERNAEKAGIGLQRYKGLGEMNPDQLWDTTMDPATRTILQVTVDDAAGADSIFTELMGDDVAPRKQFIQSHARSVQNLDV